MDESKADISKPEMTGAFDSILGTDTRLFINPSRIKDNKILEFQDIYSQIQTF